MKSLLSFLLALALFVTFSSCRHELKEISLNPFSETGQRTFNYGIHSFHVGIREMFSLKSSHFPIYALICLTHNFIIILAGFLLTSVDAYSFLLISLAIFTDTDDVSHRVFFSFVLFASTLVYLIKYPFFTLVGNSFVFFLLYFYAKNLFIDFFDLLIRGASSIGRMLGIQNSSIYIFLSFYVITGFRTAVLSISIFLTRSILRYSSSILFASEFLWVNRSNGHPSEPASKSPNDFFITDSDGLMKKACASTLSFVARPFITSSYPSKHIPSVLSSINSLLSSLIPAFNTQEQNIVIPMSQPSKVLSECKCKANSTVDTLQTLDKKESTVKGNISSGSSSTFKIAVTSSLALFVCSFLL